MPVLKNKIDEILKNKNLTIYKLNKLIKYDESSLNKAIKMQMSFPEHVIDKILPILEVSREEFTSWIVADKYPENIIKMALQELKNSENSPVLTKNIDKILSEKNLSRTQLSKIINYSQSGLNRMIVGKISMSQSIIAKIAPALEIPEDTLRAWVLAGKYSQIILEMALNLG